jgi:four helix bundle protein
VPIKTYKDLNVFRESYHLALDVSRAARAFPAAEQFELVRQLRRAARSVPANIVEGWAKRYSASEFKRYLQVAIGSCDECKLWLEGYLPVTESAFKPFQCSRRDAEEFMEAVANLPKVGF